MGGGGELRNSGFFLSQLSCELWVKMMKNWCISWWQVYSPIFRSGEEKESTEIEFNICNVKVAFEKSFIAVRKVQGCGRLLQ